MDGMIYHTIVTHENPDLDAILSSLLLKQFGEELFSGVSKAKMDFVSAGALYKGENAQKLLAQGIITVDTGGGQFDTHPDENNKVDQTKLNRSASDLVAEYLGKLDDPQWKLIIEYTRIHDSTGTSLISSDQIHHLTSIQSILNGLKILFPGDNNKMIELGSLILKSIANYYNKDWESTMAEMNAMLASKVRFFLNELVNVPDEVKEKLITWTTRIENKDPKAFPTKELDITVNIRTIFLGAWEEDENKGIELLHLCLDAIIAREQDWYDAVIDLKENAVVKQIEKAKICFIKSFNPLVIKASRFVEKADITIFQDGKSESITFLIRKHGRIRNGIFRKLIQSIRIAECVELNLEHKSQKLSEMGDAYSWFFHQSGNFIINGSAKAKIFTPTKIKIEDLLQLTYCEVGLFLESKTTYEYPGKYRNAINKHKLSNLFR